MTTSSPPHVDSGRLVIGREVERASILDFVDKCEKGRSGQTMYVCGSPGVGKTLCVQRVLEEWVTINRQRGSSRHRFDYLNVIGLNDHLKVFTAIENLVKGKSFVSQIRKRTRKGGEDIGESFAQIADCVDSVLGTVKERCVERTTCVFVLDEIDYLCSSLSAVTRGGSSKSSMVAKRQLDLITNLFTLPQRLALTNCCLVIIGIANSIDLSSKIADLTSNTRANRNRTPLISQTLIFKPYSASELKSIVTEMTGNNLDPVAVEICSRKVAAMHGDCRKVIDLVKQAKSHKAKRGEDGSSSVQDLMTVMDVAYKSQGESSATLKALPLQQLLVLVAGCRYATSHPERTEFPVSDLKVALSDLISSLNIPSVTVGHMTSIMEHLISLSNSGLVSVRPPSGMKKGTWRLNCPPDQLGATLCKVNDLVASAICSPEVRE
jgi:Cdc6-like AAA superfamily ATPase